MKNAAPWIAIVLTLLAGVVTAVVWVPSVAQEAVKAHDQGVDTKQDVEIRDLKKQVQALVTAQAVMNERMKSQNDKLDRIIEKLEE